jgi:Uma2 family endonuclease
MADPARHVPTFEEIYEEIRRLPEHLTGEILEPGIVRTMSRPGGPHRFSARRIVRSLGGFDLMDGGSGWWFEVEPEIRFGERLAVPDIAGWKIKEEPDFVDDNPITVVPDWCCEIPSTTTARDDRQLKLPLYARAGVGFIWLVDPELKSVEVFQARDELPALVCAAKDEDTVELPPFDASFAVGSYWKRTRESRTR